MLQPLDSQLKAAFYGLSAEIHCDSGAYLGQGIVQINHNLLVQLMPTIKARAQTVSPLLGLMDVSFPDNNGNCFANFDFVAGTIDDDLDRRLRDEFKRLSERAHFDFGTYLGHGLVMISFKNLSRSLLKIKQNMQEIAPTLSVTCTTSPDKQGICLINLEQTRP